MRRPALALALGLVAACSSSSSPDGGPSAAEDAGSTGNDAGSTIDAGHVVDASEPTEASVTDAGDEIAQLLALTSTCAKKVSTAPLALNAGDTPTVDVCGLTGALFTEFAFTLAGAVTVSAVIALALSPMLCSRFFKSDARQSRFAAFIDRQFEKLHHGYERRIHSTL